MNDRSGRRLFAAALCLLLLVLGGCGTLEPELGHYRCLEVLERGIPMETPESTLLLDQGGLARFEADGEGGTASWRCEKGSFTLNVDGQTLTGSWEDGIIRLSTEDEITMVFVREDREEGYREQLEREREALAAWQESWNGDWYGWWRIDNSGGELADTWYDLCARLTPQSDGSVYLRLWDEDQSAAKPMCEATLRQNGDGSAAAAEGYFWLQPLGDSDWTLRQEDGRITLAGHHEAGGECFDYSLCLRAWGEKWDDPNERPYYYESWYLPLIEAGKTMPSRMNMQKLK